MTRWKLSTSAILCLACAIGQAHAQGASPMKGLGTILGGGMPDISSIGAGNAAGLLGYCIKNKYLSGSRANSVVSGLVKKPGVAGSPGYSAGQAGQILNGSSPTASLSQLPSQLKSQACNMVLKKGAALM